MIVLNPKKLEKYLCYSLCDDDAILLFGDVDFSTVLDFKKVGKGVSNETFAFSLKSQTDESISSQYMLKIFHQTDDLFAFPRRCEREYDVLRSLEQVDFPVPHAFLCESNPSFIGCPFLIMQKEKVLSDGFDHLALFSKTLARLHNLKIEELALKSLKPPINESAFAEIWVTRLKDALGKTRHYKRLKTGFDDAISWLESNQTKNMCPRYSLIHGDFHFAQTIMTSSNTMKVIDWDGSEIGDPAFDVGYAYNVIKLLCDGKKAGYDPADQFIAEYLRNSIAPIGQRLEFYKVVGILKIAIQVSAWISNPYICYRRFGRSALARALAFPFVPYHLVSEKWLNSDFLVSTLKYVQGDLKNSLEN